MTKKLVVVPALLKAHIDSFTRKDGTFVQAHDDKRQAAAPHIHAAISGLKHGESAHFQSKRFKAEKFSVRRDGDQYHLEAPQFSAPGNKKPPPMSKDDAIGKLSKWHAEEGVDHVQPGAAPAAAPKPFASAPRKWGGHKVAGPGHEAVFKDKAAADKHAERMNAVHAAGRMDELHKVTSKLAKEHAGFDTLEEKNSDSEDFGETSRQGVHSMLHAAYAAGRGKKGAAGANKAVAEAHKHHMEEHASLEPSNSGEDFQQSSKWGVRAAIHHAFAAGHADKEAAKAKALPKNDPKAAAAAGAHVREKMAASKKPLPGEVTR